MTINEFDVVEVTEDVGKIKKGMRGGVIDVYTKPHLAYEVEFSNEHGEIVAQDSFLPNQIKKLNISREEYIKEGRDRLYLMS